MRAAPAFQVSVQRFGVWRGALVSLAMMAVATMVAWVAAQPRPIGVAVWALAATGVAAALVSAISGWRQAPIDLRWDGQAWHLGPAAVGADPGELSVMLDLGAWMLLRFRSTQASATRWLPVQRAGLEASWHALRCAVHAARPVRPDDDAIAER